MLKPDYIYNMDCLCGMQLLPSGSVDMVLCDPPYGVTRCNWDTVIPLDAMWEQYLRVVKENGAIVLFSAQPFTSALVQSLPKLFRYEWIWEKPIATNFLNAKKAPLRAHENILVFYRKPPTYHPQITHGHKRNRGHQHYIRGGDGTSIYGKETRDSYYDSTDRYPRDVQFFPAVPYTERIVPTQKPVELCEFLIRSYTAPGELVLDNCMGSGTTGVACVNAGRRFVGFELDEKYFEIAQRRIEEAQAHVKP